MKRTLFGTDGVRGTANTYPMTAEAALRLATAAGQYFRHGKARVHRVVIGKDTRRSGYMIENALTAGFLSTGMDVVLLGPIPTPAVGMLTHSMRADVGVMISASHNPHHDNGIKFFGPDGYKLSDAAEAEIEALFNSGVDLCLPDNIGRANRIESATGRYVEATKATFPNGKRLDGLKIVIDCANGAAYRAAPEVLWELGAEVIPIGVRPNGYNINNGVGSTAPETAVATVLEHGADMGICLDGDADRIAIIDEKGNIADGDQIMGLIAARWAKSGVLRGGALVATVMSNLGLERWLGTQGIGLHRTDVGDRYVVDAMRRGGFNLGGEQSGHIVMSDYATTGDGLLAGLQFLAAMVEVGKPASELAKVFTPYPQVLKNIRFTADKPPLETVTVQAAIKDAEASLLGKGRLLIRKSGTEPLIRVMVEAEDQTLLRQVIDDMTRAVRDVA
ncbi:MAG: phosphoglucosamine mutase [Planktomarina sp.]|jgi:phosphoglucosamine mutase|nr:phosphoglucosamine mutase [Planktomarina sp.]MDT2057305.1 phosphoglucosamine mutase [Planktomarina sp.]HAJ83403.1 phosphoglucosamine mutase [Paracoccaceae bacterium]|tara:strand:- start:849 stop:2192 length:1344 start_codon:yes stop_codon:yes gene_type:complete